MAKWGSETSQELDSGAEFERRKSERTDVVVRVEYTTVDQLFSEFARNINEGGVFVETDQIHPLGTEVHLQFAIPGSEDPLEVVGRVVHMSEGTTGEPQGVGIEFDDLDNQARSRINQLVRELRTRA